jgi:hypothetical protein
MRKLGALLLCVALCGATAVPAEPISKADRKMLLDHLKMSRKNLEKATKGLSEAQWNFKPAPDRWSVAECYEHLAAAEDFLFNLIQTDVLKTPAQPDKKNADKQKEGDAFILKAIADRSQRAQAPEPLRPTNRFTSPKGSQKHFADSRKKTMGFIKSTPEDLRAHFRDFPVRKDVDAVQWFLLISAHTQRHTAQIEEVKADLNFPKK